MLTVTVPTARTTSTGTLSTTSGSFTVGANDLLVACVGSNSAVTTAVTHTVTDSGGGTWTQRAHADNGNQASRSGAASVWTRAPAAAGSITVTATIGGTANGVSLQVYTVTGQAVAPIGSTSTGNTTTASTTASIYTNTQPSSAAFVSVNDWNATGTATSSDLTITTYTIAAVVSGVSGFKVLGPGGAQTAQFTFPAAPDGTWAALEILNGPATASINPGQAPPTYGVQLGGPTALNLASPFALYDQAPQAAPPDTPPWMAPGGGVVPAGPAWAPRALVFSSSDTPGPAPSGAPTLAATGRPPAAAPAPTVARSTADPATPPTTPPAPTAPGAGPLPAWAPVPVLTRSSADPAAAPPAPAAPAVGRQPAAAPTAVTIRVTADPAVTLDTPPVLVVTRVATWPLLAAPGPLVAQVRDVTPLQPSASPPVPVVALAGTWPLAAPRALVTYSTADPVPSASPPVAVVPAVQLPPTRPVNAVTARSTFTAPDQTLPPVLVAQAGILPPPAARAVVVQSPGQPAPADGLRRPLVVTALRAVAGAALALLHRAAFDPITPPIVRPGRATVGGRRGTAADIGVTPMAGATGGAHIGPRADVGTSTGPTATGPSIRRPPGAEGA